MMAVFHGAPEHTMGNRLSKITTRTGDDGTTGLGDGSRVPKNAARIVAIGDVDELNSSIGVLLAEPLSEAVHATLLDIQHDLFDLGGELAIPGRTAITTEQVERLDRAITEANADLPPLKEFILPGGTRASALAHVCRTVCRRAERALITLADGADFNGGADTQADSALGNDSDVASSDTHPAVGTHARLYLNRLSDLLFVLSRAINRSAGVDDVFWRSARTRSAGQA